ncbi:MAG: LptE family protein [Bacteroidetes bacterium]|nr:LptE family protein [Bacteroidota bacterium]
MSWLTMLVLAGGLWGCRYSFTGGKLEGESFSVQRLENAASLVVPTLAQDLTERLRDKFLQQTRLNLLDRDADLQFSGSIVRYDIAPLTVQSGDQASQNRMTLTVKVKFVHKIKPEDSWEEDFSNFVDFPASQNAQAESLYLPELVDKIVQDIFNKTLSNW